MIKDQIFNILEAIESVKETVPSEISWPLCKYGNIIILKLNSNPNFSHKTEKILTND